MLNLSIWYRLLIFIVGMILGFFFLLKPLFIVNTIGKSEWSEMHLPGGTYGAVKLFGLFIIIMAVVILFN